MPEQCQVTHLLKIVYNFANFSALTISTWFVFVVLNITYLAGRPEGFTIHSNRFGELTFELILLGVLCAMIAVMSVLQFARTLIDVEVLKS